MGFYPPASLVRDAQRRGVEVLPPDVNLSETWCALVAATDEEACADSTRCIDSEHGPQAVRIGLAYIQSVGEDDADALVAEREANGPFRDVGDLARRVQLAQEGLVALVEGGACDELGAGATPGAARNGKTGKIAAPKRRDLLWELGLANRPVSVPGTRGAAKQLTL